jgi:hypothetical protein
MARVCSTHHVLGVELLLSEFRDGKCTVLLRSTGCERCKTHHEEVEARERNHIHSELTEVAVELTRESKARSSAADRSGHKVVQVSVGGSGKLKSAEADIVECLIIKREALVSVLHELMHRQSCVIGLDYSIGHLR